MKFLCLHGNGTNSDIMSMQTAPLRHELEDEHSYEFVEANLPIPMATGIETLSLPNHQFYAFYNPDSLDTIQTALVQLDDYVSAEGPFDAVMGFSAGAVLAALYVVHKQRQGGDPPFKCGVFLSSANCTNELAYIRLEVPKDIIRIPTVHIWGSNDRLAPTGGEDLSRICEPTLRLTLAHDGGHEVPREGYVIDAVHVIRRTVYRALHM